MSVKKPNSIANKIQDNVEREMNRNRILRHAWSEHGIADDAAIYAILNRPELGLYCSTSKIGDYPYEKAVELMRQHEEVECRLTVEATVKTIASGYEIYLGETVVEFTNDNQINITADNLELNDLNDLTALLNNLKIIIEQRQELEARLAE